MAVFILKERLVIASVVLVGSCLGVTLTEPGKLSFALYYGDHMVLQRGPQRAIVWGYAPVSQGTVSLNLTAGPGVEKVYQATVSPNTGGGGGVWAVTLDPVYNATEALPHTIMVTGPGGTIQLKDVLFGDVWVCSGQSNMQFTVSMGYNASTELEDAANYPNIRVFTAREETANDELDDLKSVLEPWSLPNKSSLGGKPFTYFSSLCWLYGKNLYKNLRHPIGLIDTTWGGTAIEEWSSAEVLQKCNIPAKPNHSSVLWNAMVHPFTKMTIFGAIWYQGEANANAPHTYNCTFPNMIADWRKYFSAKSDTRSNFPFGFAQNYIIVKLSAFRNDSGITTGFPDIRWHQTADIGYVPNYRMPDTFMAVAMDLPDFHSPWGSVHPRDKQTVADRLAISGLTVAYNLSVGVYNGPFPQSFMVESAYMKLYITYDVSFSSIAVKGTDGFEVICAPYARYKRVQHQYTDDVWSSVPIYQSDDSSVTLDLEQACANQTVAGVRYAWRESPCAYKACAIYSVENSLPAPPFVIVGNLP